MGLDRAAYDAAIQAAYNNAAEQNTGAAKPLFEKLRDAHGAMKSNNRDEWEQVLNDVAGIAQTDKAAKAIFDQWNADLWKAESLRPVAEKEKIAQVYAEWITAKQSAFNAAAAKSTGAAKPKFERVRDAHAALNAMPWPRTEADFYAAVEEEKQAWKDVKTLAQTDKAAANILSEVGEKISQANDKYLKDFGL